MVSHLIETAKKEELREKNKLMNLCTLKVEKEAGTLVGPAKKCAAHHRSREKFYVKELEKAEAELKEKGVTVEAIDPRTGFAAVGAGMVASGAIAYGNNLNPSNVPRYETRVDPVLQGNVERAKNKMLDHGQKAEKFEKFARMFSVLPVKTKVELSLEDVHLLRLEK